MLKDRSYIIPERMLNQTKAEFADNYSGTRESLNLIVEKRPNED
jgi:hypothetical protein